MARILNENQITELPPGFKFSKLQEIVGGFVELVYLSSGEVMAVNEDGKRMFKDKNELATTLASQDISPGDYIVGPAVVMQSLDEIVEAQDE